MVHEFAHRFEENNSETIYEDGKIVSEFIGKRNRLFDLLSQEINFEKNEKINYFDFLKKSSFFLDVVPPEENRWGPPPGGGPPLRGGGGGGSPAGRTPEPSTAKSQGAARRIVMVARSAWARLFS